MHSVYDDDGDDGRARERCFVCWVGVWVGAYVYPCLPGNLFLMVMAIGFFIFTFVFPFCCAGVCATCCNRCGGKKCAQGVLKGSRGYMILMLFVLSTWGLLTMVRIMYTRAMCTRTVHHVYQDCPAFRMQHPSDDSTHAHTHIRSSLPSSTSFPRTWASTVLRCPRPLRPCSSHSLSSAL